MAVDKRIELEIAIRDTASLALKAVAENLENINKALGAKSGHGKFEEGEEAFKKIKEHTEGIRKTAEEGAKQVTGAAEAMVPLAATLLRGTLGKVVLWEELVRFATNYITGSQRERQEWHAMAEDTGLKERFVSMLVNAQTQVGIKPEQAKANIMGVMNSIQDMAHGRGSELTKRLGAIGEQEFAHDLEDLAMAGKREEAVRAVFARYDKLNETQQLKFAYAFKIPPSFFKGMSERLKTVQPTYMASLKGANDWMLGWTNMATYWANSTDWLKNTGIKLLGPGMPKHWTPEAGRESKFNLGGIFGIPDDKLEAWKERNKEALNILQDILGIFQRQQNKQSLENRWVGGSVLPGRSYLVGEHGPETFRSNAGWMEMLGGGGRNRARLGGQVFRPPTGGEIIPGAPQDDPNYAPLGTWPGDRPGEATFGQRFQGGPSWAVPGDPEETWNRLNRGLNQQPNLGFGEGDLLPGEGMHPTTPDVSKSNRLWGNKNMMERQLREYSVPWGEESIMMSPKQRASIDRELGGGGAGSLGAQIIFNNVPEGVETNADADGFDSFTVNKTRQLQARSI